MRIYTDDDIRRVDRTWLGPPGRRLPWVATYREYVTILVVAVGVFSLMVYLGFPMSELLWLGVWGFSTAFIVKAINNHYRDDVGILNNFITAYQEISVPRADGGKDFDKNLILNAHTYSAKDPLNLTKAEKRIVRQRVLISRIRAFKDKRTQK